MRFHGTRGHVVHRIPPFPPPPPSKGASRPRRLCGPRRLAAAHDPSVFCTIPWRCVHGYGSGRPQTRVTSSLAPIPGGARSVAGGFCACLCLFAARAGKLRARNPPERLYALRRPKTVSNAVAPSKTFFLNSSLRRVFSCCFFVVFFQHVDDAIVPDLLYGVSAYDCGPDPGHYCLAAVPPGSHPPRSIGDPR